MRKLLITFFACFISLWGMAENYPYRSDVLWVTVPDHADWIYKTGEEAHIEVQFYKYGIPRDGVVNYEIGTDLLAADHTGSVTLKGGRAVINMGTARKPCFRDLRLIATVDGVKYEHHVKVGFSPEKITPFTHEPDDFKAYWDKAVSEDRTYPLKYTREWVKENRTRRPTVI